MITATFGDSADALRANSYAPGPIPPGKQLPIGPFAILQLNWAPECADFGVGVLCHLPVARGVDGVKDHQATWLAALNVAVSDTKARAAIEAVIPRTGPVRVAADSRVYLFQLRGVSFSKMAREWEGIGRVELIAAAGFAAVSGYSWENGSPLDTPRSSLPVMSVDAAQTLLAAIDAAVEPFVPMPAGVMCTTVSNSGRAGRLQEMFDEAGLSPETVARELGIDAAAMSSYVSGEQSIPDTVRAYLARMAANIERNPIKRGAFLSPLEQVLRDNRSFV